MARKLGKRSSVKVEGLKKLNRRLKKLEESAQGKALGNALLEAAEPIRDEWARLAPRSDVPGGSTGQGHAADHIRTKLIQTGGLESLLSGGSRGPSDQEVHVGPEDDFWYLTFPEFGTPDQPAQAPGRTAADTKMKEAVQTFRDELEAEIREALR